MGEASIMIDIYNDVMLRRWSIDVATGRAECLHDAVDITTISTGARQAIEAKNADIADAIAIAETLELQPEDDLAVEVVALLRLRAGEASEEDVDLVTARWGGEVDLDAYGPPAVPVPAKVSAAQAKLALDAVGLLDDVTAMVAVHPVRAVQIWFADANDWERWHPYVPALGLEMSLDDDAIDALFLAADRY